VSAPAHWVPVICSKELAPVPGAVLVGSVKSDDLLPKGHSSRDGLDIAPWRMHLVRCMSTRPTVLGADAEE
jgi:hypothetical protein